MGTRVASTAEERGSSRVRRRFAAGVALIVAALMLVAVPAQGATLAKVATPFAPEVTVSSSTPGLYDATISFKALQGSYSYVTMNPGGQTVCEGTAQYGLCQVARLGEGTYEFTVTTVDDNGDSAVSSPSYAEAPSRIPGPRDVSVSVDATTAQVSWAAALPFGHPVKYRVETEPAGPIVMTHGTTTPVSGLKSGVAYRFKVTAEWTFRPSPADLVTVTWASTPRYAPVTQPTQSDPLSLAVIKPSQGHGDWTGGRIAARGLLRYRIDRTPNATMTTMGRRLSITSRSKKPIKYKAVLRSAAGTRIMKGWVGGRRNRGLPAMDWFWGLRPGETYKTIRVTRLR